MAVLKFNEDIYRHNFKQVITSINEPYYSLRTTLSVSPEDDNSSAGYLNIDFECSPWANDAVETCLRLVGSQYGPPNGSPIRYIFNLTHGKLEKTVSRLRPEEWVTRCFRPPFDRKQWCTLDITGAIAAAAAAKIFVETYPVNKAPAKEYYLADVASLSPVIVTFYYAKEHSMVKEEQYTYKMDRSTYIVDFKGRRDNALRLLGLDNNAFSSSVVVPPENSIRGETGPKVTGSQDANGANGKPKE